MTPTVFNQGRGRVPTRSVDPESAWIRRVSVRTLAGGVFLAIVAFFGHKGEFALGLLMGSFLAVLNLHCLKILTGKVLRAGERDGRRLFWIGNAVRWLFLALSYWFFLRVSPFCLAGGMAGYLWFLAVLAWAGFRSAAAESKL